MKNKFEPYFYTVEMRSNTFLSDLDFLNIEDFKKLNVFKETYNVDCSLIDLAGMWHEFMVFKLDCLSCGVNADWFGNFYEWLVDKEKEEKI